MFRISFITLNFRTAFNSKQVFEFQFKLIRTPTIKKSNSYLCIENIFFPLISVFKSIPNKIKNLAIKGIWFRYVEPGFFEFSSR